MLVLGAETEHGQAVAAALAGAGAAIVLATGSPDAAAAFAVQRLARRLGAQARALGANSETAFRVMARQVGKALNGLDAAVLCSAEAGAMAWALRYAGREIARTGGGVAVVLAGPAVGAAFEAPAGVRLVCLKPSLPPDQAAQEVVRAVAGALPNG